MVLQADGQLNAYFIQTCQITRHCTHSESESIRTIGIVFRMLNQNSHSIENILSSSTCFLIPFPLVLHPKLQPRVGILPPKAFAVLIEEYLLQSATKVTFMIARSGKFR